MNGSKVAACLQEAFGVSPEEFGKRSLDEREAVVFGALERANTLVREQKLFKQQLIPIAKESPLQLSCLNRM